MIWSHAPVTLDGPLIRFAKKQEGMQMTKKPTYEELEQRVQALEEDAERARQLERVHYESEEMSRTMMAAMDDMIYVCSSDFRVVYMNPAMIRRTGYDATGEFCYKTLHARKERCPWCVHGAVMEGKSLGYEVVSPKDGRSFHVSNVPMSHADGSISKMAVIRDITELNQVKMMLQGVVNESPVGISIYDSTGQCVMANDAYGAVIGATREQVLEQNWRHIESWKKCGLFETVQKALKENRKEYVEISLTSAFGEEVALKRHLVPFRVGNELYLLLLTENVTERKRAEELTRHFEGQLLQTQKTESLGGMAVGIASEFQEYLFPIIESTEAAIDQLPENCSSSGSLDEILKTAKMAKELVRQILTMGGQLRCQQKKVLKVQTVVAEALTSLRRELPEKVEIREEIDRRCRPVHVAPPHMHQIVTSLFENAFYVLGEREGCITVSLTESAMGSEDRNGHFDSNPQYCILLSVSVAGAGIKGDWYMGNHITPNSSMKGSGVSFAAVCTLVKACGGELMGQCEPDGGCTIDVYLPGLSGSDVMGEMSPKGGGPALCDDDKPGIDRMKEMVLNELGLS